MNPIPSEVLGIVPPSWRRVYELWGGKSNASVLERIHGVYAGHTLDENIAFDAKVRRLSAPFRAKHEVLREELKELADADITDEARKIREEEISAKRREIAIEHRALVAELEKEYSNTS